MSEAELHALKVRLRGGVLNKGRRGEYHCILPTGFVYNEAGDVVLDPDSQVRETLPTSSRRSQVLDRHAKQ